MPGKKVFFSFLQLSIPWRVGGMIADIQSSCYSLKLSEVRVFDTVLTWCFPIRPSRDEHFTRAFSTGSPAYYSQLPESERVLMGNDWDLPAKSCAQACCPKTPWISSLWLTVTKHRAVALCVLIRIRPKFMSCSQWMRSNEVALAISFWLYIVHFQLLLTKSTDCWMKCGCRIHSDCLKHSVVLYCGISGGKMKTNSS